MSSGASDDMSGFVLDAPIKANGLVNEFVDNQKWAL